MMTDFKNTSISYRLSEKNNIIVIKASELISKLEDKENLIFEEKAGGIQRNIDQDHLDELNQFEKDYYVSHNEYMFPTPLVLAERNKKYAIIDGQHRYECIKYLYLTHEKKDFDILISILSIDKEDEYDFYFELINKNKPVHIYNVMNWKQILKKLEKYFISNWPMYLKKSDKPQIPHINISNILKYIDDKDMIKRLNLTYDKLVEEIEELNKFYKNNWKEQIEDKKYIIGIREFIEKCENKDAENTLYLGIYRQMEWIDRIIYKLESRRDYDEMEHTPLGHRVKIPKVIREDLWTENFGDNRNGNCYICERLIQVDKPTHECGHILSVFYGGETKLSNLKPVCPDCNEDMRTMNMEEYKIIFDKMYQ